MSEPISEVGVKKKRSGIGAIGTGRNFPSLDPNFIDRLICYMLVNIGAMPFIGAFMNLVNRTRIIGRENLGGIKPPFILASNHLTLLDDLFLGPILFFPKTIRGYRYIPYHAPEERNFYKRRFIAWLMRRLKAIPVIRGQGVQQEGLNRLIEAVKRGGILHIYPEGTRTRNGLLGPGKVGVGRLVYESNATVVPVYHQGLENVLPIGEGIPRIGKEIRVAVGAPLSCSDVTNCPNSIQTWKLIVARIMEAIDEQRLIANARWGSKPIKPRIHPAPLPFDGAENNRQP